LDRGPLEELELLDKAFVERARLLDKAFVERSRLLDKALGVLEAELLEARAAELLEK
jgi:hypothetical protein